MFNCYKAELIRFKIAHIEARKEIKNFKGKYYRKYLKRIVKIKANADHTKMNDIVERISMFMYYNVIIITVLSLCNNILILLPTKTVV